uniref:Uncharacterized protein n=1 Tax=Arundo donax TaxID=35708 RepID=A0A0A9CCH9_ARUDO
MDVFLCRQEAMQEFFFMTHCMQVIKTAKIRDLYNEKGMTPTFHSVVVP